MLIRKFLEENEIWISIYKAFIITIPILIWLGEKIIRTHQRKMKKLLREDKFWQSIIVDIQGDKFLNGVICRNYNIRIFDAGEKWGSIRKLLHTYIEDGITYWCLRYIESCAEEIREDIRMRRKKMSESNQKLVFRDYPLPLYKNKEYNQIKKDLKVARRK